MKTGRDDNIYGKYIEVGKIFRREDKSAALPLAASLD